MAEILHIISMEFEMTKRSNLKRGSVELFDQGYSVRKPCYSWQGRYERSDRIWEFLLSLKNSK